jgi:hypothetical protein
LTASGGTVREPRFAWRGWPALSDALTLFVSLRLVFGLFALYLWFGGSLPGPCHFELALNGWTAIPPLADSDAAFPLVGVWQRWDACWYTKIATYGYGGTDIDSVNFWPLFPMAVAPLAAILGNAAALAGLIVSGIAYVAAIVGLERLVTRDFDRETAVRTAVLISIFPTAFFFFAPFTESLFLALAAWCIVAARERRWWLALVMGLLASLTRIQGLFLALPIAWEAFTWWRSQWPARGRGGSTVTELAARSVAPLAATAAPVAGFLSFVAYTSFIVGKSNLDAQDAWGGRNFHPPWEVADAAWSWAVAHHDALQALNLLLLVVFVGLVIVGLRTLPLAYSLFAIPQLVLLTTRIQPTPLTSTARYLLVLFPAFVVLARIGDARIRAAWMLASAMFLALLLQAFLRGDFVA